jgi:hypothetical protein
MGISFNDNDFSQNLRSAMGDQVNAAMTSIASSLQDKLDAFCAEYLGRPIDEVRSALIASGPAFEIQWTNDSETDEWARAISDGHRIVLEVPDVEL